MYHRRDEMSIPRGQSPPTQLGLPAEFHNNVQVFEIIDDGYFPGYVYLVLRYLLRKCSDGVKATEFEDERLFLSHPKYVIRQSFEVDEVDDVPCLRCLVWLTQAADWPTRHRKYGWPDSATVDHVVRNGCDVVAIAHRQCRQDEWMSEHQWRLSFSRAEIALAKQLDASTADCLSHVTSFHED